MLAYVVLGLLAWVVSSLLVGLLVGRMIAFGARRDRLLERLPGESFSRERVAR